MSAFKQFVELSEFHKLGEQAEYTDRVANEVYASHYSERKMYRLIIKAGTALLLGSLCANVFLAARPQINRYIRIDEMGRAQAIQYTDLSYSPREGEIRTYLTDWANYRYTLNRDTVGKKYPLNYYFLSASLSSQLMGKDSRDHLVTHVMSGQIEQGEVEVRNVLITDMSKETVQGVAMARGTAVINMDRIYSAEHSREPRTEHWEVNLTYYLNPQQVSQQAQSFPQFETINPLGLTITQYIENRVGVELPAPQNVPAASTIPGLPPRVQAIAGAYAR